MSVCDKLRLIPGPPLRFCTPQEEIDWLIGQIKALDATISNFDTTDIDDDTARRLAAMVAGRDSYRKRLEELVEELQADMQ